MSSPTDAGVCSLSRSTSTRLSWTLFNAAGVGHGDAIFLDFVLLALPCFSLARALLSSLLLFFFFVLDSRGSCLFSLHSRTALLPSWVIIALLHTLWIGSDEFEIGLPLPLYIRLSRSLNLGNSFCSHSYFSLSLSSSFFHSGSFHASTDINSGVAFLSPPTILYCGFFCSQFPYPYVPRSQLVQGLSSAPPPLITLTTVTALATAASSVVALPFIPVREVALAHDHFYTGSDLIA